ncbi:MAG: EAL domain-containing protein, partial [Acidimicrobiales bacterium]|nr:EAL domain-containing protein [Acidimicrobiales bacterium]
SVRAFLSTLFGYAGYQTIAVRSLSEARRMLASERVEVISVLLDDRLPDGRGVELLREIRASPRTEMTPVIMVTGHCSAGSEVRGLEAGATDFVAKPFDPEALVARVSSRLRDRAAWLAVADLAALTGRTDRMDQAQRQSIERTIREQSFRTVFQPIVDLRTSGVVGSEALTRFDDGSRPDQQFRVAAGAGLGPDLELATLGSAIRSAPASPAAGFLSLNVSPQVLSERASEVRSILGDAVDPLVLEITEREAIDDYDAVRAAVSSFGPDVRLSIDDAGAGFASLRHVVMLEPAFVKLDRSWTAELSTRASHQAMVAGLVHFAATTGCHLIAEGIETAEQRDTLLDLGVEMGQGYLYGKPMPPERLN